MAKRPNDPVPVPMASASDIVGAAETDGAVDPALSAVAIPPIETPDVAPSLDERLGVLSARLDRIIEILNLKV